MLTEENEFTRIFYILDIAIFLRVDSYILIYRSVFVENNLYHIYIWKNKNRPIWLYLWLQHDSVKRLKNCEEKLLQKYAQIFIPL